MKDRKDLDQSYIGTCFDRQVRIEDWDQKKLQQQTVIIIGVGGLGSIVLFNLLRLGIKKIFLVDYDVVQTHNLNRQLMFSPADVGKSKVDSAIKNAQFHNLSKTELVGMNINAVKQWQKIVEVIKQCNFVFNCIDYGQYYDLSVASLCLKNKIPLIMGGTFATSFTVDFFSPIGAPCYLCTDDSKDIQVIKKISPQKIQSIEDLSFLPRVENPISRSSSIVCTICGQFMVSHMINYLFLSEQNPYKSSRLIFYHNTFEIFKFELQLNKKCYLCGDPNYVQPQKPQQPKQQQQSSKQQSKKQQSKQVVTYDVAIQAQIQLPAAMP